MCSVKKQAAQPLLTAQTNRSNRCTQLLQGVRQYCQQYMRAFLEGQPEAAAEGLANVQEAAAAPEDSDKEGGQVRMPKRRLTLPFHHLELQSLSAKNAM